MQTRYLLLSLLIIITSGCGGGSEGTGIFGSGVEKSRALSTLTESEKEAICRGIEQHVNNTILTPVDLCQYGIAQGLVDDDFEQPLLGIACEEVLPICVDEVEKDPSYQFQPADCFLNEDSEPFTCNVPALELEECIKDILTSMFEPVTALTCANATPESVALIEKTLNNIGPNVVPPTPACVNLVQKCPEVLKK